MGYFGSMYSSNYNANAPSSNSMMFMPNAYGGYSTVAAGSPAGSAASQQLLNLRNLLGGQGGGQAAFRALAPYEFMAVKPMDMGNQMQRTFGQAGINLGQATEMAQRYMDELMETMEKDQKKKKPTSPKDLIIPNKNKDGPRAYAESQQRNPLDSLGGIFSQYGSGGSFGSGWGYR